MPKSRKPKAEVKEKPARLERRVRVMFFLVSEIQEEIFAVGEIIYYLHQQYWGQLFGYEYDIPVTGFTHSFVPKTVTKKISPIFGPREKGSIFVGQWWSEKEIEIKGIKIPKAVIEPIEENVTLFVIDLPAVAEEWKFDEGIVRLKEEIFSAYARNGRPQEEIWMVKQDIYRYA